MAYAQGSPTGESIAEVELRDRAERYIYDTDNPVVADMTVEQGMALVRLLEGRIVRSNITISVAPFDLPRGYIMVVFAVDGYTCGISPEGRVSS